MFNKKQNKPARKLTLNRETVRRLSDNLSQSELQQVAGGRSGGGCSDCCPAPTVSQSNEPC